MIFVQQQPEPTEFDAKVRKPGKDFQRRKPYAKARDLPRLWTQILPDLWRAYSGICAYSCHLIPPTTGAETVDHFVPKAINPQLVYEWSNYRLAASKYNHRKSSLQDIIDPFKISGDWFVLVFPGMLVKPGPQLPEHIRRRVQNTIDVLKLNEEVIVQYRLQCILEYCDGNISQKSLQKNAPFIAYELARQGLTEQIRVMTQRRKLG